MFVAWVLFPLVLLALCAGIGLLVDTLTGRRLPGILIAPTGFAAIIVVASFTTMADATAELTTPLVVFLALAGFWVSLPLRWGRASIDRWAAGVAVAVFAVYAAPIVLTGDPTFAGYIRLDDTATWIAMTDRVMEHGRSLEGLAPSTYERTLAVYSSDGYPIGSNLPWGVARGLTGADNAWVFQPYLAFMAAMLALTMSAVSRPFVASPRLRALAVFIAAQAALLFAFAMWGGLKELAAALLIGLAAGVVSLAVRREDGPQGAEGSDSGSRAAAWLPPARLTLPLATTAAALAATLSYAGLVWIAPLLAGGAIAAVRVLGLREAAIRAAWLIALGAVLTIPVMATGRLTPPVENSVTSEAVLNLLQPLNPLQVFGIWPSGDFRFRPEAIGIATALAVLAALAGAAGLWLAARVRALPFVGYVATTALGCAAIAYAASPWVDSKALATASPGLLLAAMAGAAVLYERSGRSPRDIRAATVVLIALLTVGVLWSNALVYRDVSLAPYERFSELEEIGEDFAGEGPALMTEYNPYGARHFLRELDPEAASELRVRQVPLRDGSVAAKGESVDVGDIDTDALLAYRTLVLRRGPDTSRPPSPYELVWQGDFYEVWQRPADAAEFAPVLSHQPIGSDVDAGGLPNCSEVRGLGLLALANQLGVAPQDVTLLAAPAGAPVLEASDGLLSVERPGPYIAWLGGSVTGEAELLVDGEPVASANNQVNNEGGFVRLGRVVLTEGEHTVEVRFEGADLHPGSGAVRPNSGSLVFEPAGPAAQDRTADLVATSPSTADELCGRRWDWIEAVGPTP